MFFDEIYDCLSDEEAPEIEYVEIKINRIVSYCHLRLVSLIALFREMLSVGVVRFKKPVLLFSSLIHSTSHQIEKCQESFIYLH